MHSTEMKCNNSLHYIREESAVVTTTILDMIKKVMISAIRKEELLTMERHEVCLVTKKEDLIRDVYRMDNVKMDQGCQLQNHLF